MSLNKVKYSILIPTKNGCAYLKYAIQSALTQGYLDFELIVSDNHSIDETEIYLSSLVDPRIKIVRPEQPLPMAEHYEFMLTQATGEWVTIIGDDDALMPYFFDSMNQLTKEYPEIEIISSPRAYYFWEGCIPGYNNTVVNYKSSGSQKIRTTKIDFILAILGLRSCFDLPQLYTTSVIKRSLIIRMMKVQGGWFYHSIIPDMYSAVCLFMNSKKYLRLGLPLFWVGTSSKSMGISTRIYEDSAQASNVQQNKIQLNSSIPQEIHAAGFGSMYLYEGLLQYPGNQKKFIKCIQPFVMASIFLEIYKNKYNSKITKNELVVALNNYINVNEINKILIALSAPVLIIVGTLCKAMRYAVMLKVYIFSRLELKNYAFFISKDRARFKNIELASIGVKELRK